MIVSHQFPGVVTNIPYAVLNTRRFSSVSFSVLVGCNILDASHNIFKVWAKDYMFTTAFIRCGLAVISNLP
jgi:hypothetical protein